MSETHLPVMKREGFSFVRHARNHVKFAGPIRSVVAGEILGRPNYRNIKCELGEKHASGPLFSEYGLWQP